jgi:phosphatidylinositol alpha-1,6-mannosyltransferase
VLIVTNDFPPRQGGIETFVATIAGGLPADQVVVYTSRMPGSDATDAALPYPVLRDPTPMLVPTPAVRRRVTDAFAAHGCDRVLFGAAAPLGLLASPLRAVGARRVVGITHGHELWWARVPGPRGLLRRIGDDCDTLTYLADYTRAAIAEALSPAAANRLRRMPPGVDITTFTPCLDGRPVRQQFGIAADARVLACISRLTPRKGQDTLIRAWPRVLAQVPAAVLLITGTGEDQTRLRQLATRLGVTHAVRFAGGVPHAQTPGHFAAADVFGMICRDRRAGLEVEGLGIVFLEAAACGLPVIVGRSGGAVDTVVDGSTGFVVDPTDVDAVAAAAVRLLGDPGLAQRMGAAGRAWVEQEWTWEHVHTTIRELLDL